MSPSSLNEANLVNKVRSLRMYANMCMFMYMYMYMYLPKNRWSDMFSKNELFKLSIKSSCLIKIYPKAMNCWRLYLIKKQAGTCCRLSSNIMFELEIWSFNQISYKKVYFGKKGTLNKKKRSPFVAFWGAINHNIKKWSKS